MRAQITANAFACSVFSGNGSVRLMTSFAYGSRSETWLVMVTRCLSSSRRMVSAVVSASSSSSASGSSRRSSSRLRISC